MKFNRKLSDKEFEWLVDLALIFETFLAFALTVVFIIYIIF